MHVTGYVLSPWWASLSPWLASYFCCWRSFCWLINLLKDSYSLCSSSSKRKQTLYVHSWTFTRKYWIMAIKTLFDNDLNRCSCVSILHDKYNIFKVYMYALGYFYSTNCLIWILSSLESCLFWPKILVSLTFQINLLVFCILSNSVILYFTLTSIAL